MWETLTVAPKACMTAVCSADPKELPLANLMAGRLEIEKVARRVDQKAVP